MAEEIKDEETKGAESEGEVKKESPKAEAGSGSKTAG